MSEILDEVKIRGRFEITVPSIVRDMLNLSPGDIMRFEQVNGNICVCKAVTRKVNHNCGGDGNGRHISD